MKKERNYGIDLLRIVAMLMVCLLHILGQGGLLKQLPSGTIRYYGAWFLEISAYGAVNCYALISGFVGGGSKFKYSSILTLWLQVAFIMVTSMLAMKLFFPELVSSYDTIRAFFPVQTSALWYYTAYFGMSFFIPVLNHILQTLPKKQLQAVVISIIVLFTVVPFLAQRDLFNTGYGYSVLWLAVLYLVGGYLGRYPLSPKWTTAKCFGIFLVLSVVTTAWKLGADFYPAIFEKFNLVRYTSPTILLGSMALVIGFSRCKISRFAEKIIRFFAPLTFSVYIIHSQGLIFNNFLAGKFGALAHFSAPLLLLTTLGCAVGLFLICSLLDLPRHYLFRLLRISQKCRKLDTLIEKHTENH